MKQVYKAENMYIIGMYMCMMGNMCIFKKHFNTAVKTLSLAPPWAKNKGRSGTSPAWVFSLMGHY